MREQEWTLPTAEARKFVWNRDKFQFRACGTCRWLKQTEHGDFCFRYPAPAVTDPDSLCGEWQQPVSKAILLKVSLTLMAIGFGGAVMRPYVEPFLAGLFAG